MGRITKCLYKLGIKNEVDYYQAFIKGCFPDSASFDYIISDSRSKEKRGPLPSKGIKALYSVSKRKAGGVGIRGKPIDFDRKIDENDGNIYLSNFVDGFFGGVERSLLYNMPDSPVFSVIDLNSAHHFTYILAKKAFSLYPDKYKMIVNVDQHLDFDGNDGFTGLATLRSTWKKEYRGKAIGSKVSPRVISCGNWGMRAISYGCEKTGNNFSINPLADAYLSIGGGDDPSTAHTTLLRHAISADQFKTGQLSSMAARPIKKILEQVGDSILAEKSAFRWADTAVYLTLDRDVMVFNGTKYKDGAYCPKTVHDKLKEIFDFFKAKKAVIAGVDIIGLPESTGNSKAYSKFIQSQPVQSYSPSTEAKNWSIWIKKLLAKPVYRNACECTKRKFPGIEAYEDMLKEIALVWVQTQENIRTLYGLYKDVVDSYKVNKNRDLARLEPK